MDKKPVNWVKGCVSLIVLALMTATFFGLIAAGVGIGWGLVTGD